MNSRNTKFVGILKIVLATMLLSCLVMSGCSTTNKKTVPKKPVSSGGVARKEASITKRVTLYFADKQVRYLVPETRTITAASSKIPANVVKELINGPRVSDTITTIPPETRVLSVSVVNGVAKANFSKELITRHRGGQTAEKLTVYSIVDSLAKLPGINRVQFLVEGKTVISPLGDIDLSSPIRPDYSLLKPPQVQRIQLKPIPTVPEKTNEVQRPNQQTPSGQAGQSERTKQSNQKGNRQESETQTTKPSVDRSK
ncbi:MAG: GerMN domain-containing protein [Chitinophagales bacterium]